MRQNYLFTAILFGGMMLFTFTFGNVNGQTTKNKPVNEKIVQYTCPMHPEVVSSKPGNCPKCGMKLVERKVEPKGNRRPVNDSMKMKQQPKKMMKDTITKNRTVHAGSYFAYYNLSLKWL